MNQLPKGEGMEKSVLSTIMQQPEMLDEAIDHGLSEESFTHPCNKQLWKLFTDRIKQGQSLELVTLTQDVLNKPVFEQVGGASYITEVFTYAPTAMHFEYHISELKKINALRSAYTLANKVCSKVLNGADSEEVMQLLGQPVTEVHELLQGKIQSYKAPEAVDAFVNRFQERVQGKKLPAMLCGVSSLDRIYGGLPKPAYIVVTAFPSTGKTAFGLQLLDGICERFGKGKFFTCEMPKEQLMDRFMITSSGVSGKVIGRPDKNTPNKGDLSQVKQTALKVKKYRMEMDDEPRLHIDKLCSMARKSHREGKLDLIVVDYAQKLIGTRKKGDSHERELADISGKLQGLMKELGCTVVLLSQVTENNGSLRAKGGEVFSEDADYWFHLIREKGEKDVKDIVTMKDRHSGTNGWEHNMKFDKEYQRFVKSGHLTTNQG